MSRHSESVAKVKRDKKRFLRSYKAEHGCADCGEHDVVVLELDHRGLTRSFQPSRLAVLRRWSFAHTTSHLASSARKSFHERSRHLKNRPERPLRFVFMILVAGSWHNQTMARKWMIVYNFKQKRECACGEKDPDVLELHRLDPETRLSSNVNLPLTSLRLAHIERELRDCDVMCANCNRRRWAVDSGWADSEVA